LSYRQEPIIIKRSNGKAVNATHPLSLISYSLLLLKIPEEDRLIACGSHEMNIIWEDLNLGDLACVLLQVRDELTRTDLPNSDFTLETT
jgi:hypothetical protein